MQAIITITGKVLHDPFKNENNIKGCIYYIGKKKKGKAIEYAHHIIHSFIHLLTLKKQHLPLPL